jgi:ABC-type microcin C transport system permease subunit YejB
MNSKAFAAGILVALLMFAFGVIETALISSVIVSLCFALTGFAILSWLVIVGREYRIATSSK